MKDYSAFSDEELVEEYLQNEDESLLATIMMRYHNLISKSAAPLFLYGADREDLIQEGRLGLYDAIKNYDSDKNQKFAPFAMLCIRRALLKAVTASSRKKHSPLNSSVPLEIDDDDNASVPAEFTSKNPEQIILDELETEDILAKIEESLSATEWEVLLYLLEGYNYKQIAKIIDREPKSIDNALQRIRTKVQSIVKNMTD